MPLVSSAPLVNHLRQLGNVLAVEQSEGLFLVLRHVRERLVEQFGCFGERLKGSAELFLAGDHVRLPLLMQRLYAIFSYWSMK